MHTFKATLVGAALVCAVSGSAQSAVVYDSPAQNFINGITDLVVTGTANDGTFDVTFVDGSFDDAFGAATTPADLTFQTGLDADVVGTLINAALNAVTPRGPVASATSATPGSAFDLDAYLLPHVQGSLILVSLNLLRVADNLWANGGGAQINQRDSNAAPFICGGCTTKFAVFTEVSTTPPTEPSAVPEPGTLALLGAGLAGLGLMRRRRAQ